MQRMIRLQKESEDFGINEEDWNLYRGLNDLDHSDEEQDDLLINEIELELRELDPSLIFIRF